MDMRQFLFLLTMGCFWGLAGCATSPNYRAIEQTSADGKTIVPWLLPPSASSGNFAPLADGTQLSWFKIDVPIRQSTCPYSRFPKERPSPGLIQGEFVPTLRGPVLRLTFMGSFLEEQGLRKGWWSWWSKAQEKWPEKCLGIEPKVIEQMLVERSPIRFDALLKLHYGFDNQTRSVILHPGLKVCASDVSHRESEGPARFSVGGETCATATSDGHGGVVFGPASVVLSSVSSLDTKDTKVLPIANWAEIPYSTEKAYRYLLRYPRNLPTGPAQMESAKEGDFPLLIAFDVNSGDGVLSRALQCMRGMRVNERNIDMFCGQEGVGKGFDSPSCGDALPDNSPLLKSSPVCFRFGERGVLTSSITVELNGSFVELPLGTTLGSALERLIPPPLDREQRSVRRFLTDVGAQAASRGIRLKRLFEGRLVRVDLSAVKSSAVDLALLPGDQLSW